MGRCDGKVALVTGASRGIGKAIARRLASEGASVVVNASRIGAHGNLPGTLEATAAELQEAGAKAAAIACDLKDSGARAGLIERASEFFGPIDILVNNAGNMGAAPERVEPGPFWEASRDSWDAAIGVNLYGVIHCTSAVIPGMIERKRGRLITIVSDAGRVGESGMEMYSAAKAGAAGFMRAVAKTLGRHLITANCVALAAMRTPTSRGTTEDEERAKQMLRSYTIRRFGEPDDAANMVLFLASDASSWITGQTYPVNGGFSVSL